MALLLTDVTNFLVSEGLIGGATGWTAAQAYMPPSPDQVIAVFESGGYPPEAKRSGSTETEYDEPTFQVRGRAGEFEMAALRAKMGAIYRALHDSELSPTSGDPAYVFVFAMQSGPFPLGLDENNRPGLTWNFRALRERET